MVSILDPNRSLAGRRMKHVLALPVYIMLACTIIASAAAVRNVLSDDQWVHAELMENTALPATAQAKTKVFAKFPNKDGTTSLSPAVILERHVMMNGIPDEITVMWLDGDRHYTRLNIADVHVRDNTVSYANYDLDGLTAYPAPFTTGGGGSASAVGGGSGGAAGGSQGPAKKAKTEQEPQNEQLRERNSELETNNANLQETMHHADAERDTAVAERDTAVAERDTAVAERDTAVAERDNALRDLEAANIRANAAERRIVDAAQPQAAAAPQATSERTSRDRKAPDNYTPTDKKCNGEDRKSKRQ